MEQPPGIMWISRACVELALSLTGCSILESWLHFSLVPALRRVGPVLLPGSTVELGLVECGTADIFSQENCPLRRRVISTVEQALPALPQLKHLGEWAILPGQHHRARPAPEGMGEPALMARVRAIWPYTPLLLRGMNVPLLIEAVKRLALES